MKQRGKAKKVITWVVVGVLVVGLAGAGYAYSQGMFGTKAASATTSYSVVNLTTGSVEKSVTGTGTMTSGDSVNETSPVDVKLASVPVAAGQSIKAGDTLATVDSDSINTLVTSLQDQITTLDTTIANLTASQASVSTLKTSVSGRVKAIYGAVGDSVDAVVSKNGGLLLLSTDGKMKVDFTISNPTLVAIGDSVKVKVGSSTYTGLVEALDATAKTCTVTMSDSYVALDAAATVKTTGGKSLGEGKLAINRPYLVTSTGGSISKVYVSLNNNVSTRTSLMYVVGVPLNSTYDSDVSSRDTLQKQLDTAKELQLSGKITATTDGVVNTVTATAGQSIKTGDTITTLLTGGAMKLIVSVDELDISSVAVGQTANVAVDAFTKDTFSGTVQDISNIGTTSSGVTTYKVTIKMDDSGKLKLGMNATATIVIEKHDNALLLPLSALNTSRGESYVWLYTGTLPADSSQDPGTRTQVTTGLSNANYVEITDGLTANDQVVVVRRTSTSSSNRQGSSNFSFAGGMGGNFPGGGQFQRPSGGSGRTGD